MSNSVFKFNYTDLKKWESECKMTNVIGIDTYDENNLAYCLMRNDYKGSIEIILCKTMSDRKEFDEEVKNLSKYFNAKIIH